LRLLLDTHVALWAITADPRLPQAIQDLIADPQNSVQVSAASVWEISIKHALARGRANDMPISGAEALGYFRASGYGMLDISVEHAAAVETLPTLHADPFDRLLIAQALTEPMRLITHDLKVAAYSKTVISF
jgi:PIN domain nuclease of toxin-antitoxin system